MVGLFQASKIIKSFIVSFLPLSSISHLMAPLQCPSPLVSILVMILQTIKVHFINHQHIKMVNATVIRGDATVYYRVWNLEYINYTAKTNWNCRTYLTYGCHPQLSQRAVSATQQPYRGKSSTYRTWWWWEMHWPGMKTTQVTCYIQDKSQHLWFYKKKRPFNTLFFIWI